MESLGKPELPGATSSEPGFTQPNDEPSLALHLETEDDVLSEDDGEGAADTELDVEEGNEEPESSPAPSTEAPKQGPMLGLTEEEIRVQQAALANEYSQVARVVARAFERRISLTLRRMEQLERREKGRGRDHGDNDQQIERPPLTRLGKLLSYQVTSIQSNSRHEALNIWREFYRQKMDLREQMGSRRQKSLARLKRDYARSLLARSTDVPVMDWISENLDTVHYLTAHQHIAPLEDEDAAADLQLMREAHKLKAPESDKDEDQDDEDSGEEYETEASPVPYNGLANTAHNGGLSQLTAVIGSPEPKRQKMAENSHMNAPIPVPLAVSGPQGVENGLPTVTQGPKASIDQPAGPIPGPNAVPMHANGLYYPSEQQNLGASAQVDAPANAHANAQPDAQADAQAIAQARANASAPLSISANHQQPNMQPGLQHNAPQSVQQGSLKPSALADVKKSPGVVTALPHPQKESHHANISAPRPPKLESIADQQPPRPHAEHAQPPLVQPVPVQMSPSASSMHAAPMQQPPQPQQHTAPPQQMAQTPSSPYVNLPLPAQSPQSMYQPSMLPPPQGMPQGMGAQGMLAGYPYYSGYPFVQGYPQYQFSLQQPNVQAPQPSPNQGYVYCYPNQWQPYMQPPQGVGSSSGSPWPAQYTVWPPQQ